MTRIAIMALAAVLLVASSASAARRPVAPYLAVSEAKAAAEVWSQQWASGFSESPARITERCRKIGRDRARCRVRIVGDRLDATVTLVIRETPDDYLVSASDLRLK